MNILNLLSKEKHVAGIEISDSVVRIAFFRPHKKKTSDGEHIGGSSELILIEEPIAANIIVDGIVVDVDLLGKTLKAIWEKARLGTNYAIVAIPEDTVHSRIFSFPKIIDGTRLTEAMRLAVSFQLPMSTDDVYLDWERTQGTPTTNEILFSMAQKIVVQGYVAALDAAGIKTLALESHLAAIARAVKLTPGRTAIFSQKTPDGTSVFALKDGVLRFSRTLPLRFVPQDSVSTEIEKVKTALAADEKGEVEEIDLTQAAIRDDYAEYIASTGPKAKWIIALGAAIRGRIPEGEDNLVSLLPVGTEEAYAYQKATTFAVLIRNTTIGTSVFFMLAFFSIYLFMTSLLQNASHTVTTLSTTPVSPDLVEKESRVKNANALALTGAAILSGAPAWDVVLDELSLRMIDGIVVSNFSAPSVTDRMSLSGTARDRVTLNQFKRSLQESPLLADIEIPTANLEQRESIPFSASFRLRDPSKAYYK